MKQLKALLIDDVKLIRSELKLILADFKRIKVVGEAGNVSQALRMIREKKPDILFLDIHLPDSSGFDLLDMITDSPDVIFISSYFYKYSSKIKNYNPVGLLSKPIRRESLYSTLENLLEKHGTKEKNNGSSG
ncbi:MAG TPA: response regulator [Caldithrix abyssi]|uniref:Response regulator n=1 Tax=Caldithrix abyssi TaxID=187145 RepID=A0A7V5RQP2_CALAY|nr:response regulator [Caldithrix abyssi]